jgi:SAM-dependent methyltransferase
VPKLNRVRAEVSPYDAIAELYDPWSRSVVEDVDFYVREANAARPPVVELGVGTGRVAIPIAAEGIAVIGVDSSARMLDVCRQRAQLAGVTGNLDLRLGDLRRPPIEQRVELAICPFRSFLHLEAEDDRRAGLESAFALLQPGGRLIFDVFAPGADDIEQTHGRWLEREPGIHERALWDAERRRLVLSVRGAHAETTMSLAWVTPEEWRALLVETGFEIEAHYGWFDRSRYRGGEDSIWVARRPAP